MHKSKAFAQMEVAQKKKKPNAQEKWGTHKKKEDQGMAFNLKDR